MPGSVTRSTPSECVKLLPPFPFSTVSIFRPRSTVSLASSIRSPNPVNLVNNISLLLPEKERPWAGVLTSISGTKAAATLLHELSCQVNPLDSRKTARRAVLIENDHLRQGNGLHSAPSQILIEHLPHGRSTYLTADLIHQTNT